MAESKPKIIVIQGPTASGKTSYAIEIARKFDGEIVNSDSLQWIRHFNIGTAKPSKDELNQAKHWLIDAIDPDQHADVSLWKKMAEEAISDIISRKKVPITCGGTGLYIRALLGGLVKLPQADENLRAKYDEILAENGVEVLFDILSQKAPDAANHIDRHNPPRIVRALEVLELTGKNIWEWQAEHKFSEKPFDAFHIVILPDMEKLAEKIKLRSKLMLEQGLIDEVKNLLQKYPDKTLNPYGSIGYKQVVSFLDGELEYDELVEAISRATLKYAKKQLRWLKKEESINYVSQSEQNETLGKIEAFLKN